GGGGGAGIASFFDVFTELPAGEYPADSFFDLFVEMTPPAIDKASPMLAKPPNSFPADSFFDVFFDVSVEGGVESMHLHGEIGPGQPLTFSNVNIPGVGDSFFDIFVQIDCAGCPTHTPARDVPLFTMTLTGDFVPEPATMLLLVLGMTGILACSRRIR
ncbi:MAG: PEP-CTERM sorting domain-containing protein, partial [Planctomycetes bacterium]|nr:PEP-CTERM sorting domain-containing protein [Planctomycetota bacterium]